MPGLVSTQHRRNTTRWSRFFLVMHIRVLTYQLSACNGSRKLGSLYRLLTQWWHERHAHKIAWFFFCRLPACAGRNSLCAAIAEEHTLLIVRAANSFCTHKACASTMSCTISMLANLLARVCDTATENTRSFFDVQRQHYTLPRALSNIVLPGLSVRHNKRAHKPLQIFDTHTKLVVISTLLITALQYILYS